MHVQTSIAGDTIDSIVYRHYGDSDMLESVLNENPDVRDMPDILPAGTRLNMPSKTPKSNQVKLWD